MRQTRFTFNVIMNDVLDHYDEEVVVKDIWPYLIPFMTKRKGIDKGSISLQDGAININWEYELVYEYDEDKQWEVFDEISE